MRILFIRHAIAVKREEFEGEDLARPLTTKGVRRAQKAFKGLKKVYSELDLIFHSGATRSIQTAKILKKIYGKVALQKADHLNPGSDYTELVRVIKDIPRESGTIAIVGHEPDLSEQITGLLLNQGLSGNTDEIQSLPLDLKKASCLVIEQQGVMGWSLVGMYSPSILRRIGMSGRR